jgi:hypothetical protein
MSQGRKYAPPPGRGASVEAAGAVRSMCHALRIHPLGACLFSTDRNHSTPKSHGTMRGKYCCKLQHETSAAAGTARLPRRTRPPAWPGDFEFAVVADFDDLEGYQVCRDIPDHRQIIGRLIQPIAAPRAAVQYEFWPERALSSSGRSSPRCCGSSGSAASFRCRTGGSGSWSSRRPVSGLSVSPWPGAALELFRPRGPGQGLCGSNQTWIPGECHDQS